MRQRGVILVALLACAVSYVVGSQVAISSIVDQSTSGIVAFGCFQQCGGPNRVLDENGVTWSADEDPAWGWQMDTSMPQLPFPVSEVKFWAYDTPATYDNHV